MREVRLPKLCASSRLVIGREARLGQLFLTLVGDFMEPPDQSAAGGRGTYMEPPGEIILVVAVLTWDHRLLIGPAVFFLLTWDHQLLIGPVVP